MSRRLRTLGWLAGGLAIAAPSLALAFAVSPDVHERVLSVLSAIEAAPSPARLDEIAGADGAGTALRDIASTEQRNEHARLQAISALASYPDPVTVNRLGDLIQKGGDTRSGSMTLHVRAAALSLARLQGADSVPAILPLLEHAIPDVRADAARALAMAGSATALPALRRRLQVETSALVRVEIVDAIRVVTH